MPLSRLVANLVWFCSIGLTFFALKWQGFGTLGALGLSIVVGFVLTFATLLILNRFDP